MIHRRVFEAVGGYDAAYPMCNDFDLWLRAAPPVPVPPLRAGAADPLPPPRRRTSRTSRPAAREVDEVSRGARGRDRARGLGACSAPEAVDAARARSCCSPTRSSAAALPLPELAARAARARPAPAAAGIVMTSFGYNDSGGGTIVPRQVSQELARRGYDVTVFHAARRPGRAGRALPGAGVVAGRRRAWSASSTARTACSTWATPTARSTTRRSRRAFAELLDRVQPDVVHFHNLHNLGRGADRRGGRARDPLALHDPQLLAGLPARLPLHRPARAVRRAGRPRRRLRRLRRQPATPTATAAA